MKRSFCFSSLLYIIKKREAKIWEKEFFLIIIYYFKKIPEPLIALLCAIAQEFATAHNVSVSSEVFGSLHYYN